MFLHALIVLATLAAPQAPQSRPARAPDTDRTIPATKGMRLAITNFAGEVMIRAWDQNSVRIQARHNPRNEVTIRTSESAITVNASNAVRGSVDYDIQVPASMPIKVNGTFTFISIEGAQSEVSVDTVRGDVLIKGGAGNVVARSVEGEVIVEGARGRINVNSTNEAITITGASGDIVAETVNGSITMTKIDSSSAEAGTINGNIVYAGNAANNGRYRFTTHNGNVTVGVPENANATFVLRTYQGSVQSTLPTKAEGDVRRGRRATYTMGNGSAEFEIETFGGSIRLRRPEEITIRDRKAKDKEKEN